MLQQIIQCFGKHNTESDEIIITFTDQNGRPLERGNKVNLTLLFPK